MLYYFNLFLKKLIIFLISLYKKFISPFFYRTCIYYPSCSSYCVKVFEKFTLIKAIYLSFKRILRCNSLFNGGIDNP